MSRETLVLLLGMLNMQSIPVGAENFEEEALKAAMAKRDLIEAIHALDAPAASVPAPESDPALDAPVAS